MRTGNMKTIFFLYLNVFKIQGTKVNIQQAHDSICWKGRARVESLDPAQLSEPSPSLPTSSRVSWTCAAPATRAGRVTRQCVSFTRTRIQSPGQDSEYANDPPKLLQLQKHVKSQGGERSLTARMVRVGRSSTGSLPAPLGQHGTHRSSSRSSTSLAEAKPLYVDRKMLM